MTHGLAALAVSGAGRVRMTCACGWATGQRASRAAAQRAYAGHVDAIAGMSAVRARAIQADHTAGLHEVYDGPDGCGWIGCADSYWLLAATEDISKYPADQEL